MIHRAGSLLELLGGWRRLLGCLFISLGQAAALVPVPLLVNHVFAVDLPRGDVRGVIVAGLLMLVLYLASSAFALWARTSVLAVTKRAVAELRRSLVVKLYALPMSFHDRADARDLQVTIVQDSERLDVVANAALGQMLPAAVVSLGLAVVALVLDPLLFAVLACSVPAMVLVKRRIGAELRRRTRVWQDAFAAFSTGVQTSLRAQALTQARGTAQDEVARLTKRVDALSAAGLGMARRQGVLSVSQGAISSVAAVLVLIIGGSAVADRTMSLPHLISFYAVVALLQGQVGVITAMLPLLISGGESLTRLTALLEVNEPPAYSGSERISFSGQIRLRGVTFGYGGEPVLRNVDLEIEPGEHVIVLGPNGAGKSSLVSLILGLYGPAEGEVLADGIPYRRLEMRALRADFGVLLQDPVLLPGTIADNIAYGRPTATDAQIRAAAELADAAAFIEETPAGYQTIVGNEGARLSGGQRQRVALARALIGEPRVLVLDEPTTHLDDAAIARLCLVLSSLSSNPTIITITHDESLAGVGDRVLTLRQGRLAHDGSASASGRAT